MASTHFHSTQHVLLQPAHLLTLFPGIPLCEMLRAFRCSGVSPVTHDELGCPLFSWDEACRCIEGPQQNSSETTTANEAAVLERVIAGI